VAHSSDLVYRRQAGHDVTSAREARRFLPSAGLQMACDLSLRWSWGREK